MFSAYLARNLKQITHCYSYRPSPFLLRSVAAQHGSPFSPSTSSFFQAFRQTLGTPSGNHRFSTLDPPHVQKHYETINLTQLTECGNGSKKLDVIKLVELLRSRFSSERTESTDFLDESGIEPSEDLIASAIWDLRDDWKLAFFVFKWGQKRRCDDEKGWSLIIWVLGNHKKFNNAWCLIRDLYRSSMDTQRPMLVMIGRYAAANEPAEAIRTFQIMEKFKLSPDQTAFYTLLHTLCKHANVEEAEEFMFLNAKLFPLETEGFNIILGGWCDVFVDILEAKRVWKEMDRHRITPDENSYTHMISCFSKVHNLFDSLRLYDEMKKKGWRPNRRVYNSLVYVLAHENCHEKALRILHKMNEVGQKPDAECYNSIIRPLCQAGKVKDARSVVSRMSEEKVEPTLDTYHAFLEGTGVGFEERLELVERMVESGNGPTRDTFGRLIRKLFELDEVENALRVWVKMKEYEVLPDGALYMVVVEGLVRHGFRGKAMEVHGEMISNGFRVDPKLKKLLKEDERREMKRPGIRSARARKGVRGGRSR